MIYHILKSDFDSTYHFQNWQNLKILDTFPENFSESVIMGGDILRSDVRNRLNLQLPTIYVHRGNLGNHLFKKRKWWRFSINGFANTKILSIPYSRWPMLDLPKHPWKVKKIKNILIAPSKGTSQTWTPELGNTWPEQLLDKFPGSEIRIRKKEATPGLRWNSLWRDLDWADLVIAQASSITVEAFWYGKKVISLFPCSTWAAGCSREIENWDDPCEPENRDLWHEHLAWSQFTNEEIYSEKVIELVYEYFGSVEKYNPEHSYKFT